MEVASSHGASTSVGFLAQPKGVYAILCFAKEGYESSVAATYRDFAAHLVLCRPKSLVSVQLVGHFNPQAPADDATVLQVLIGDGEDGEDGALQMPPVEFAKGSPSNPPAAGSNRALLERGLLDVDTFQGYGQHNFTFAFHDAVTSAIRSIEGEIFTKTGSLRKAYVERRIICVMPDCYDPLTDRIVLDGIRYADGDPMVASELARCEAHVDVVLCPPDTGPQLPGLPEALINAAARFFHQNRRYTVYTAESYHQEVKKRTLNFEKKSNAKVRYNMIFNQELMLSIRAYILTQRLKLPSSARTTRNLDNTVVDRVYVPLEVDAENVASTGAFVSPDVLKKGYRYGCHVIPVGPAEDAYLSSPSTKSLRVLKRLPNDAIPSTLVKGCSEVIFPEDNNNDIAAFHGLVLSLYRSAQVLLCKNTFRDGLHPQLCYVQPAIYQDKHIKRFRENSPMQEALGRDRAWVLVLNYLPWSHELRVGYPVRMPGFRTPSTRPAIQRATPEQIHSMTSLISALPVIDGDTIRTGFLNPMAERYATSLLDVISAVHHPPPGTMYDNLFVGSDALISRLGEMKPAGIDETVILPESSSQPVPGSFLPPHRADVPVKFEPGSLAMGPMDGLINGVTFPILPGAEFRLSNVFPLHVPKTATERKAELNATLKSEDLSVRQKVDLKTIKLGEAVDGVVIHELKTETGPPDGHADSITSQHLVGRSTTTMIRAVGAAEEEDVDEEAAYMVDFDSIF